MLVITFLTAFAIIWLMFCGYRWCWGPFCALSKLRCQGHPGNAAAYHLERVKVRKQSVLKGKNILYLGSSVTYGASSMQTSFAEYISKRNGNTYLKEAVSGTTLVDQDSGSYVSRLKMVDPNQKFDLVVVQLSTNDATQKKPLGTVQDTNPATVCGAINFIIGYVRETFHCPVVFYTGSFYESEAYASMVAALKEIAAIQKITVIDLYTDVEFNRISKKAYHLYMADPIHPTMAGYLKWWTPKIEEALYALF